MAITAENFVSWDNYDLMLVSGSTEMPYEPYQGVAIPISWQSEAGTVYGGTLDVTTGTLVIDRAEVDLGTLRWAKYADETRNNFYTSLGPQAKGVAIGTISNSICSRYAPTTYATVCGINPSNGHNIASTTRALYIHDDSLADADAATFKTAMSGVQLVYELAEPQTYQLTPTEIRTLLGQNNIWADTGDTSVEYPADTKLYIDRKITEAIASALNA